MEFLYSKESIVWIATDNGLFFVDRISNEIIPFVSDIGQEIDSEVSSLTETKNSIFCINLRLHI